MVFLRLVCTCDWGNLRVRLATQPRRKFLRNNNLRLLTSTFNISIFSLRVHFVRSRSSRPKKLLHHWIKVEACCKLKLFVALRALHIASEHVSTKLFAYLSDWFSKNIPVGIFHLSIDWLIDWFVCLLVCLFALFCFTLKTLLIKLYNSWFNEKTVYLALRKASSRTEYYQWHVKFCGYVSVNTNEILVARVTRVHFLYTDCCGVHGEICPQIYFLSNF